MSAGASTGWSFHRGPFTFTRVRIAEVAGILVVLLVGALLPYSTLAYEDYSAEPVRATDSLFPAARLFRLLNLRFVPANDGVTPDDLQQALDLVALGTSAHQVGLVVAVLTCWGLFMDEINKFLWWPLHLSGWVLIAGTVSVWIGVQLFQGRGVDIQLLAGWVPLTIAGIVILVITFRARSRIDTYRGA